MIDIQKKYTRPDINLEALLAMMGVLLGFLFIIVIYILENPTEISTMWGPPLICYLSLCYATGLSFIAYVIRFEINVFLINHLSLDSSSFLEKYEIIKQRINHDIRRSVQTLLFFIFSFGLFLSSLAGFSATKLFFIPLNDLNNLIILSVGEEWIGAVHFTFMFVYQLILIFPFSAFAGNLWDSFKEVVDVQNTTENEVE